MGIWPFRRSSPQQDFWDWFQKNRERLHGAGTGDRNLIDEVSRRLKRVNLGLVPEFGVHEGQAVEVVISADGDKQVFPAVFDVVEQAPEIPGWKVTAFRQPGEPDVTIEMNGKRLEAASLWFRSEPDQEKVGLTVLIPDLSAENNEQLSHMAFLLLDNALGEFLVESSVDYIDFGPLPDDPEAERCLPFATIADYVQQIVQ